MKETREEKLQRATQYANDNNLPELQGSEKQIAWAMSIRQDFIDLVNYNLNNEAAETEIKIAQYMISSLTSAATYIEKLNGISSINFDRIVSEYKTEYIINSDPHVINTTSSTDLVDIIVTDDSIKTKPHFCNESRDVNEAAHNLYKKYRYTLKDAENLDAVGKVKALLENGFAVRIQNDDLRDQIQ